MKNTSSSRLDALRELLQTNHCTHILVTDTVDVAYCSGFHASHVLLLISAKKALLCTDFRYRDAACALCAKNPQWQYVELPDKNYSALIEHCPAGSVAGIQSNNLTLDQYGRLRRSLKKVTFKKVSADIADCLVAKQEHEIIAMKKAAHIGDRAFARILLKLHTGITEAEAAHLLDDQCRILGSEKPSFDTMALFGARSALPHGIPGNRRLKKGDWVLFDFGCTVQGLSSDMTRTIVYGTASEKQRKIYAIVLKAQKAARDAVCAGALASDVDACARTIIADAGYGELFGHATGHGVGRRVHESPRVSSANTKPLPENSVITIEPGIYIPGFGGVRIEDMVAVRHYRGEVLTQSPRELIELGV